MENQFTWYWEANDWYPWALPNTTDYMYSSYHVNSASRRDPGVYTPSTLAAFIGCGDASSLVLENNMSAHCRDFFPGWSCSDETITNYSSGNCSASCGYCTTPCFNVDLGATNSHGYGCELYDEMPILCDIAESFDDDDFTASFHCCVCGGGSRNTCLPNDFVVAPFNGNPADTDNALVRALNTENDTIIMEFPYRTSHDGSLHEIARSEVTKYNGRECSSHSNVVYDLVGWGRR